MVSVIIPTRNEPLIQRLVEHVHNAIGFVEHEIIVVDKSEKVPAIPSAKVVLQRSTGLGRAILEGLEYARGTWTAVMDADFSHRPEDLARMLENLNDWDFVLGSRYTRGGRNMDLPFRRLVSRTFNLVARIVLGLQYSDPMSGLIFGRTAVFRKIRPNPIGYKINLEILYRCKTLGFRAVEVPIVFHPRRAGRSKAGVREGIRTLAYILALKVGRQ